MAVLRMRTISGQNGLNPGQNSEVMYEIEHVERILYNINAIRTTVAFSAHAQ